MKNELLWAWLMQKTNALRSSVVYHLVADLYGLITSVGGIPDE
jgi:hypothetical protein